MKRFLSVLAGVTCLLAVAAYAQVDWGTNAGSRIIISGDVTVDSAGEGQMDIGGVKVFDPLADTSTVQAVFNLGPLGLRADKQSAVDDTIWFYYQVFNQGNGPDSVQVQVNVLTGNTFTPGSFLIYKDKNMDSLFTAGTDSFLAAASYTAVLAEDAGVPALIGVVVPGGAADGQFAKLEVNVKGNNKTGTNDAWPASFPAYTLAADFGDWQRDTVQVTVGQAVVAFLSSVDRPSTKPGDTLTYSLRYDNDGSAATVTMPVVRQLLPKYVRFAANSVNTASMHTGETGTIVMYSSRSAVTSFSNAASWANANPDSVAGMEVTFMTILAANDTVGDGGADTAGVNGQMPDTDAGRITFKVIVK